MQGFLISHKATLGVPRGAGSRVSLDIALVTNVSVDETEGGCGGVGALEGCHAGGTPTTAVRPAHQAGPATQELGVELLPEALAQQVEGKRVDTGVGEGQEAGTDAGDEVEHGGVHLGVVVGAVQVDDVVGEPAEGEEAHEHQHGLGEALPGFYLRREPHRERERDRRRVWEDGKETKVQTEDRPGGRIKERVELTQKATEKEFNSRKRTRENPTNETEATEIRNGHKKKKSPKLRHGKARKQKSMR